MKLRFLIIGICLFCTNVFAQEAPKMWSLEDCINYALEHNISAKQLQLQQQNAEVNLHTAKMSRLPDLRAGVGQNWNFGRTNNNELGVYQNQTISNSNFSLSSSMNLFNGFKVENQVEKSKLDLAAATQQFEKAKEDLALNIASLFLQVLFNKEILRVNEEQFNLTTQQEDRTKKLLEAGKVSASQLYDVQAQLAQDEVNVTQAKNTLMLSLLDLAQSLELENAMFFDVQAPGLDSVSQEYMNTLMAPDAVYSNAVNIKPGIKQQQYLLESYKRDLKMAQSGYYPALSLYLSYGNNYFYNYNATELLPNQSFSDQIKNNGGEAIGLNLNIPIFNRYQVKNQVQSTQLSISRQELELENAKKSLYKEIQTAYANATAAREKYHSSERAVKASEEALKYAQERYDVGKLSAFEFEQAKNKLIQSRSSQIQSKYEYIFRTKILDFYNGIPIKL